MTYSEKLKHPKWQKKRLEVLQKDNFTCQFCGEKEKTLHVHHYIYRKGMQPWDYELCDLGTLCKDCHKINHFKKINISSQKIYDAILDFSQMDSSAKTVLKFVNNLILHG